MSDMFSTVAKMAGKPLKWAQVSKYAIVRGKQSIAKVFVMGCTLYELWDGDKRVGSYNDADEAKAAADGVVA